MNRLTDFALNNSRTVIMIQALIVITGIFLFPTFPKLEDPPIVIREAVVTTYFPGMPADRVDRLITRPLEEAIRTLGLVDKIEATSSKIRSTSKFGESIIHVTVKDDLPAKELPNAWQRLRNKMNDAKRALPDGTVGPMVNDEFGDTAVATIALVSEGFSLSEMRETARNTREKLITLPGILKVDLYGVQEERIYFEFSNAKMAELGVSVAEIKNALVDQNIILPGGKLDITGTELIVEPTGKFKTLNEIRTLLVTTGQGKTVELGDIGTVRKGYVSPPVQPVYYNGQQAIVLSVCLLPGVDAVTFGRQLTQRVEEIESSLPWGYSFKLATFQPKLIQKAVGTMVFNVATSLIIVLVVVVLLLGFRTGMIVGSFIPMVMLSGVIAMYFMNIEMQRMSLAAMIIALGMLVDNGICVAEEITTRMQLGTERRQAVLEAGRVLAVPLLTSTLTTVFAFCPMVLQDGAAGDYTRSLGLVIMTLLLCSWFLSMISTTSACNWFIKVEPILPGADGKPPDPYTGKTYRAYRKALVWMLGHRTLVVAAVVAALGASIWAFTIIPVTFFPEGDRNQYLVYLDFPAGTRLEETERTTREIAAWLGDKKINPELTDNVAYVGSGGPRFFLSLAPDDPDSNYAFIVVNTASSDQVSVCAQRTRQHLLSQVPNARGRVKAMWLGGTETGLLEIRLRGPDKELLLDKAEQVEAELRDIPGALDIRQDWNNRVYSVKVDVDQARARRSGLTTREVGNSLDNFISGKKVSDFYYGHSDIPIIARGETSERTSLDSLSTLGVYSKSTGKTVPLMQVSDIYGQGELDRIKRYNQEYTVTVSAKHQTLGAKGLFNTLKPALEKISFPKGHYWQVGGEIEESAKSQRRLAKWFPICFLGIIALLVWQFNSFRRAAIIILTIPLVLIGAVIGLLVMNASFGFMVILGLLALAGSIVNNGIVLIDRIETLRQEGMEAYEAVIHSCVNRFRAIFLSVATTALGLITLIFPYDPLFYGMACVFFFGLLVGTVFTLGFVPVAYSLFFRVRPPTKG